MQGRFFRSRARLGAVVLAVSIVPVVGVANASNAKKSLSLGTTTSAATSAASTVGNFSYGQLQAQTVGSAGCGTNAAGEPAIHVSRAGNVFLGSENGLGGGSELWRGLGATGGSTASGCSLEFRGSPNSVTGVGASGGDIDLANAALRMPRVTTTSTWRA